MAADLMRLSLN